MLTPRALALGPLFLAAALAQPPRLFAAPLPPAEERALVRADSLAQSNRMPAARHLLDSLDAVALARSNVRLAAGVRLGRAGVALYESKMDEAERWLAPLAPERRAARDTLLWVRGLRMQGRLEDARNRPKAAAVLYTQAIALSSRAGLRAEEARVELAVGFSALRAGRGAEALDAYTRALAAANLAGEPMWQMRAHAGLARAFDDLGRVDEARRANLAALDFALRVRDVYQQAETMYNLGVLEHQRGDGSKAEGYYQRALALYTAMEWKDRSVLTMITIAIVRLNTGRLAEADSILSLALPAALSPGVGAETRARVICQMGVLRRQQGRWEEAIEFGRRAVAATDSIPLGAAMSVTYPLLGTLAQAKRLDDAERLIDAQLARLGPRLTPRTRAELLRQRAHVAQQAGRPREALAPLKAAVPKPLVMRGSFAYDHLLTLAAIADCYRTLGDRDSALVWYRRVADAWESWRSEARDPVWLERYDDAGLRFAGRYAAMLLDGGTSAARVAEAFDALQRFRARTLAQRLHDPARGSLRAPAPVISRALQRTALRAGELLLDIYATPETTLVIAVARDTLFAWGAASSLKLLPRFRRLRDVLGDRSNAAPGAWHEGASALGRDLLGPGAGLITKASSLLVSAGALAQHPIGMLVVPGSNDPLLVSKPFALVPSATLLAESRSHPSAERASSSIVAFARTRDEGGHELAGARDEARWLSGRFARTESHVDDDRMTPSAALARAGHFEVVHFASHARNGAGKPWQSGLLLGRPGAPGAWLEAQQVSATRTTARLCVLAGCASVGGAGDVSETLEGLATAWIASGARTVVATQWEVDDQPTARFVRRFYERLAANESVGRALWQAQLETRAEPGGGTRNWAGFVALGDPETRVRLDRR